ncbi:hypothetical protein F5H01DRAFT_399229 [Linnemannia elongata]|nr:hypothetical protein F5H01DRAFT_399229 [Linnemannia elongata]
MTLIMEQLDDIDDAFLIDGEKSGLDSTRRRNSSRALNNDGYVERRRIGKKMDLVARNVTHQLDWMIMERQTSFDPQSSEFLREHGIGLLRETSTIGKNKIQGKDDSSSNACSRSFVPYGGEPGCQSFEVCPGLKNFVLLMKDHGRFSLPPTMVNIRPFVRGFVHLLQIRDFWSSDDDDGEFFYRSKWSYCLFSAGSQSFYTAVLDPTTNSGHEESK